MSDTRSNIGGLTPIRLKQLKFIDFGLLYVLFLGAHLLKRGSPEIYSTYAVAGIMSIVGLSKGGNLGHRSIQFLFLILLVGAIGAVGAVGASGVSGFYKMALGLAFAYGSSVLIVGLYEGNYFRIFQIYLTGAFAAAVLGLLQLIWFRLGVPLYDFRVFGLNKWALSSEGPLGLRLNSVFSEPSQFCIVMSGAVFWSVYALLSSEIKVPVYFPLVIIASYILTFSGLVLPGFICMAILVTSFRSGKAAGSMRLFMLVAAAVVFFNQLGVSERILDVVGIHKKTEVDPHGSSAVIYDHFLATEYAFYQSPVFGVGLGMYEASYKKFRQSDRANLRLNKDEFNSKDANSMLLRVVAELGTVGFVLLVAFVWCGWLPQSAPTELRVISCSFLSIFVLQCLRQGNYIYYYCPIYFVIYGLLKSAAHRTKVIESLQK